MDLVFLFGSRRFSQLSVSSFAQPISFHSNGYRHTVVNELPLRSRIPNENSDEHGLGQEDGLATSRRDTALIAAICAAPAKGTPRKWPENCLKITENEVLLWDASIEEPCFAISLRFWHSWRERLARPDQRRLYRKSLQWSQSRLLFPGPNGAPLSRAALHNALRRLNTVGGCSGIGPITPEKIRVAFLCGDPLKGGIRL